jgi:predicted nuclease of predicted toxin-antitoxin system
MIKLLIDENISYRLVKKIADIFPDSQQVKRLGLLGKEDYIVWNYAKKYDFVILTQDDDYAEMSQLLGYPPKVILLKTGNTPTNKVEELLRAKLDIIEFFIGPNYEYGCIEIHTEN